MRFCFSCHWVWHASEFWAHWDWQPLIPIWGADVIDTGALILYIIPFLWQNDNGISLMNQFVLQITSTVALEESWVKLKFHNFYPVSLNIYFISNPSALGHAVLCGLHRVQESTKAKYKNPSGPKDLLWCRARSSPQIADIFYLWFLYPSTYAYCHIHTQKCGWLLNVPLYFWGRGEIMV